MQFLKKGKFNLHIVFLSRLRMQLHINVTFYQYNFYLQTVYVVAFKSL